MTWDRDFDASIYRRLHILPVRLDIEAIAIFIASALLISHGIRRDTLVTINLGNTWLWVPGDKIKYLSPDIDTAKGWVKAVLRGKKGLGAFFKSEEPDCKDAKIVYLIKNSLEIIMVKNMVATPKYCIYYFNNLDEASQYNREADVVIGLGGAHLYMGPVIANVLIDRVEVGLPLFPLTK